MIDHLCVPKTADLVNKIVSIDIISESERRKILPLFRLVEAIDYQDVVVAKLIQTPYEGTADKSGPAGDYKRISGHLERIKNLI